MCLLLILVFLRVKRDLLFQVIMRMQLFFTSYKESRHPRCSARLLLNIHGVGVYIYI